jgi:hypothetical protein
MRKRSTLVYKYFTICFALLAFINIRIVDVHANSNDRWHVQYGYDNKEPFGDIDAPEGVKADVYTISPNIPWWHTLSQWVSIIISYTPAPGYWIQLGYLKTWKLFVFQYFYIEKWDTGGLRQWEIPIGTPLGGHTYTYAIWEDTYMGDKIWRYAILEEATWLYYSYWGTIPHDSDDLQASVETSTDVIEIEGSHFTKIAYYDPSAPLNSSIKCQLYVSNNY